MITVKTDPKIKAEAQKIAKEMGLSLSGVINAYLSEFVRTKTLRVSLKEEIPSAALIKAIKESEAEYAKGETKSFDNVDDLIRDLKKLDEI